MKMQLARLMDAMIGYGQEGDEKEEEKEYEYTAGCRR